MSEDDGSTTFREDGAAMGTCGGMRAIGLACWLSPESSCCARQNSNTGYGADDRSGSEWKRRAGRAVCRVSCADC